MTNSPVLVSAFVVKVLGVELTAAQDERLTSVVVERATSACDRFELRFDSWDDDSTIAKIGDDVEILAVHRGDVVRLLKAEVTAKALELRDGWRATVISGFDRRHRLTRTIGTRAFSKISLAKVVETIAGEHGLTFNDQTGGALGSTTYPHVVHAGSDFELLQQIARRTGAAWLIDDSKLVFQRNPPEAASVVLSPERELVAFDVRFSPMEAASKVTVYGWDPVNAQSIVGTVSKPTSMHKFPVATKENASLQPGNAVTWTSPVASQKEAESIAGAIGRRLADSAVIGHGETTGTPALVPGSLCKIEDVGDDFSGTYHVTSVEHSYGRDRSFRTRFRIGAQAASSMVDLFGGQSVTAGHVFPGVTIGVVTNIEHPDGRLGVVKVKLPYLGDAVESDWARLASFGGGQNRGSVFIPEVGDEVLVAFEHGDVSRPYVLGTLPSGSTDDLFGKKVRNGKVGERTIASRLGTKLRFLDMEKGDKESGFAIEVDDAKTRLFFGYDKTEIITQGRPLELKNGMASVLLKDDKVVITAKEITLSSSSGDVKIDGVNVKVDAKTKLAMSGLQCELKAQAQATVEASGIVAVKGSLVKVN